jgi:pimeloyl-ACP methyl ester carboxylesterase
MNALLFLRRLVARSGCDAPGSLWILLVFTLACGAPQTPGKDSTPKTIAPLDGGKVSTCSGACATNEQDLERVVELPISFVSHGDSFRGTLRRSEGRDPQRLQPGVLILADLGILDERGLTAGGYGFRFGAEMPVYQILAEVLAQSDMAVLSYDKRNCVVGQGPGCRYSTDHLRHETLLPDLLIDDAQQALLALANVEGVDRDRIFVLGHGRGADLALNLLDRSREINFGGLILISPVAVAPHQQNLEETRHAIHRLEAAAKDSGDGSMADLMRIRAQELRKEEERQILLDAILRAPDDDSQELSPEELGIWRALRKQHLNAQEQLRKTGSPVLFVLGNQPEELRTPDLRWLDRIEGHKGRSRVIVSEMSSAIVSLDPKQPAIPEGLISAIANFVF